MENNKLTLSEYEKLQEQAKEMVENPNDIFDSRPMIPTKKALEAKEILKKATIELTKEEYERLQEQSKETKEVELLDSQKKMVPTNEAEKAKKILEKATVVANKNESVKVVEQTQETKENSTVALQEQKDSSINEAIENLLKDGYRQIRNKAELQKQEENKRLQKLIDDMKRQLISELKRYQFSDRVYGNIEAKLDEIKSKMSVMNNGKTDKMVEDCINDLKKEKLQEMNGEENAEKESSSRVQANMENRKKENHSGKEYMYIEQCTQAAFQDIRRNIFGNIETYRMIQSGTVENIQETIDIVCKKGILQMKSEHDGNLHQMTQMMETEVTSLYDNIKDAVKKNKDNKAKVDDNPWRVEKYGENIDEFNKRVKTSLEKPEGNNNNKGNNNKLQEDRIF